MLALVLALTPLGSAWRDLAAVEFPLHPAADRPRSRSLHAALPIIQVRVEYDDDFDRGGDPATADEITRAFGIVNMEWQRYRREWFRVASITRRPSSAQLDASWVLGRFQLTTASAPATIHVLIVGRQLEAYTEGWVPTPVGGLAFRGSDALVVSAPGGVPVELLAYYLFHEIGHLWEAWDIPFGGGETTFGEKSRYTFEVDAGNAEILEDSPGPAPRNTAKLAPAIIARDLAEARRLTRETALLARLHDLVLHEPSRANPAWMAAKRDLLRTVDDPRIRKWILERERTPREKAEQGEVRRTLAAHYWRANQALQAGESEVAERELEAMRALEDPEAGERARILIGAVERKIRKRGR